jgi:RNA-binding protein YlmH
MGLGIKRSVLGDICVFDFGACVVCEDKTCDFIVDELKKAGRDTVRCEKFTPDADFAAARRFEEISTSVASLRLDGTVRALCNVSREEASRLVVQGFVEVNYFTEKEPDRQVSESDIISVRGHGKYIIDRGGDVTRRGRIRLIARKYV